MNFLPEDDPRWKIWKACESPIEQLLCCGLFALLGCRAVPGPYNAARRAELAEFAGETPAAFVFGQHEIRRFRVDFLVVLVDPKKRITRHFVIECDGKDYHSSDEQIAKDEARDAEIVDAGYKFVARYSGSALNGDMPSVVKDIARWLACVWCADEHTERLHALHRCAELRDADSRPRSRHPTTAPSRS